jgi:hypothetical protein
MLKKSPPSEKESGVTLRTPIMQVLTEKSNTWFCH